MKKVMLILILSLSLGICNVSAKDHHKGGDRRHNTEQRYDRRPGKDRHDRDKHKKHDRHDWDYDRHGGNYIKPRPGGHYRPTPPPPRRYHAPVPPPPPPRPRHYIDPGLAYVIGTANVIFNGIIMQGVNMPTFEVLDYGYARDARYVYYCGRRLKGADPYTFRILPDGYARDAWHVYYYGKRI